MPKHYEKEAKDWITVKGVHIPIFEGETKDDAVKRVFGKNTREDSDESFWKLESLDRLNTLTETDFKGVDRMNFGDGNWIQKRADGTYRVKAIKPNGDTSVKSVNTVKEAVSFIQEKHKIPNKSTKNDKPEQKKEKPLKSEEQLNKEQKEDCFDSGAKEVLGKPIGERNVQSLSAAKEAAKVVNPKYNTKNDYYKYHQNCQRCVVAYEAQRRGYDVEALPKPSEDDTFGDRRALNNYTKCLVTKEGQPLNNYWLDVGAKESRDVNSNIRLAMKGYGEGARCFLRYTYSDRDTGHVCIVENISGEIVFINPQSGSINYWNTILGGRVKFSSCRLVRVDDKQFTYITKQAVKQRG